MNVHPIVYPLPNPPKPWVSVLCAKAGIATRILISGYCYTEGSGEVTIPLDNLQDAGGGWVGQVVITNTELAFTATPYSWPLGKPVVITWRKELRKQHDPHPGGYGGFYDLLEGTCLHQSMGYYDIAIKVKSWALNSEPAPHIYFGWMCIAEGVGFEPPV
jgi:hypothetical protein